MTGAGRGIGRATVEAFADAGWRAVAGVRDVDAAAEAYAGRDGVHVVRLDVTEPDSVIAGVREAEGLAGGALTCLVPNAGYAVMGAVEEVDLDEVRAMFDTNFLGAVRVIQAAVPAMREAGRGSVVMVSSVGAHISNQLVGLYHASKFALLGMTEALAYELRPFGVRVMSVEPGMVNSEFSKATRRTGAAANGPILRERARAAAVGEGPYAPLAAKMREGYGRWRERYPTGSDEVAREVLAAAQDPDATFQRLVGRDSEVLMRLRADAGTDQQAWERAQGDFVGMPWA